MEIQTQSVALSKSPETYGFDLQAGESWVYPTNYPTREYQYNIIQKALLKNTLVSLPTGLGKTFIAAVVMYNFYRWYPHGKIIFMAPTKPLVKQQVEACYNIMAIPHGVTAELTGTKVSSSRSNIWLDKRVFFITPQILQNDLEKVADLGEKIKCLVFDEAHKARGNHAYCQVIRKLLDSNHKYFRVLALSATPGSNVNDISEVVHNLLISHLEFRTEESIDVQKYVFQRSLETVVVQLDNKLIQIREEYMKILEQYAKTLIKFNIIQGNCGSLTKGKIFMIMKDFQSKNRAAGSSHYSEIMRCLNVCVTLYHAFELLIRHGLRNFLSFYDEHIEKPLLRGNAKLRCILENIRKYLGPIPHIEVLPDGTYPEIPNNIKFGHPKHYKLRDILTSHFSKEDKKNTRVIVFFEYRESVMEAHTLLLQSRPLIQPKIFLGQGSGITQKTQIGVVKAFREGKCNTLLSTCIGEEGLDVGEVDLIVCFDISNKSPIRMVQRMGRTGRKRAGSVLVLVTEGKEQQTLKDCLIHKNNISTHVLGSAQLNNNLYPYSPRLVPADLSPKCEKMFITVTELKKNTILNHLQRSSSTPEIIFSQNTGEFTYHDLIPEIKMKSFLANPIANSKKFHSIFRHIEKMRPANKTCLVEHSEHTTVLNELLCYSDSKRFNIPTKTQGDIDRHTGKSMKQGDIRSMFLKEGGCVSVDDDAMDISKTSQDAKCELDEKADFSRSLTIPTEELFRVLSNYLVSDFTNELTKCPYCRQGFCCQKFTIDKHQSDLCSSNSQNLIPSEEVVNDITLENIEDFIASLDGSFYTKHNKALNGSTSDVELENDCELNNSRNKTYSFEAPTNYLKLLETLRETDFKTQGYSQANTDTPLQVSEKTLVDFFGLESLSDIYSNSVNSINSSQNTIIYMEESELDKNELADNEHLQIFDNSIIEPTQLEKHHVSSSPKDLDCNLWSTNLCNKKSLPVKKGIDIDDFCDLSYFGLTDIDKGDLDDGMDNINSAAEQISSPRSEFIPVQNKDCSADVEPLVTSPVLHDTHINRSDLFKQSELVPVQNIDSSTGVEKLIMSPVLHDTNRNKSGPFEQSELIIVQNADSSTDIEHLVVSRVLHDTNKNRSDLFRQSELVPVQNADSSTDVEQLIMSPVLHDNRNKSDLFEQSKENESKISITQMLNLFEDSCKENQYENRMLSIKRSSILGSPDDDRNISKDKMLCAESRKCLLREMSQEPVQENSKCNINSALVDGLADRRENSRLKSIRETSSSSVRESKINRNRNMNRFKSKSKPKFNEFLDVEAEVSEEENVFISDDEDDDVCTDAYEKSFVNDFTQRFNNTEMHGMYLRSIRSPVCPKIIQRHRRIVNIADIYSQQPLSEINEYVEDSFCVGSNDEDLTQQSQLSELDILERELKRKKKRKKSTSSYTGLSKRRRIKCISSEESD